ncbi:MAG: cell division protein FtsW [Verrucomicrobia bacterium RIFCSPHIGHO2_12_FULL_41_10]|nr:MAG: cell division protein FtsW [Verrucomicrobia bacterium RIFCSPHIGHO2_12_FULL_41_10]HLB32615.1 putative lipid II flippase FtsW [Chthoniobacterales bacterium]
MQRNSIYLLLISVVSLVILGIVMLFSTSAFAQDSHGDIYYFVKRQLLWLVIGVVLCVATSLIDYHWWRRTWGIWFGIALLLLALCFVPHLGMRINGSWRWLNLRIAVFQPSEFGKIATVFFMAWWFSREEVEKGGFLQTLLIPLAVIMLPMGLIGAEVDLGTTALIGVTSLVMMFVGGTRGLYLFPILGGGIAGLIGIIHLIPERAARMMTFLHPESDKLGKGLQQWQALIAFGSGGVEGLGLGEGRQKMLYLPYAHTDFIFPMIGEELGLRATWGVIFCYLMILLCGGLIAANARDRFGKLLAIGFLFLISLQAVVNIGMTISLLPNKGMPLPFISYGGSNLAACLFMVGILVNIHRSGLPLVLNEERPVTLSSRVMPRI